MGLQVKPPTIKFDKTYIEYSFTLTNEQSLPNIDSYCDIPELSMKQVVPKLFKNDTK